MSVAVSVGEELPCQREGANSEDLFAVAVMTASYRRSRKISAVWSMHSTRGTILLSMLNGSRTNFLSIYWICGSNTLLGVLSSSARNFWRKKFSREQIFASWRLIAKIAKISASRKFPAIRYTVAKQNGGGAEWVELFITLTKGMGEPTYGL